MNKNVIVDKLVRASMSLKLADDAFEVFVKPYEQVLHSMGFKPSIDHNELMKNNIKGWEQDW